MLNGKRVKFIMCVINKIQINYYKEYVWVNQGKSYYNLKIHLPREIDAKDGPREAPSPKADWDLAKQRVLEYVIKRAL